MMHLSHSNGAVAPRPSRATDLDTEDVRFLTGMGSPGSANPRLQLGSYIFKCAESPDEFEQVHRLNHRTFVEEIGQYPDNGAGYLVDKFHDKNTYFIALQDNKVVGMLATHDAPPFSVAERLSDPYLLERLGPRIMEARLFAILPDKRNGPVSRGLLWLVFEYARVHRYSHLVISGIETRARLYERMGFRALGPAVRQGDATFIPMAMEVDRMPERIKRDADRVCERIISSASDQRHPPVSLLPGPVQISDEIRLAVSQRPVSHRGRQFIDEFERIRSILSDMVGGLKTCIMVGSGTLANEVVGATIAADRRLRRGVVLVNGEFGRRLARQAQRHGLHFETLEWPWGAGWDLDHIRETVQKDERINWIWGAHLETSTGIVNDVNTLFEIAGARDVKVCLDCVSSLGALPMDISRAYLASGVSGKSVGGLAGLAFIFAHEGAVDRVDSARVPIYLDLPEALRTNGPRFTVSSPLLHALACAISRFATPAARAERYAHYADLGRYVRRRLRSFNFTPLVDGPAAAPVITSFTPPPGMGSAEFCHLCLSWGFEISGLSGYLLDRGIVQIATMGAVTQRDVALLFARMRAWMKAQPRASLCG
jgi:aspartate aminotransferase-like enzyme/N-acyl-L-homoserine lactone synthetase